MMVVAMDWMMHARENKTDLNLAIETIVDAWMQFNGNDIYCQLEAYKTKTLMRDIP